MGAENIKENHRRFSFLMILLIAAASATVAISGMASEEAFAKDVRYSGDTSQAASVSNECLNPILDSNTIDNIVDVGNCAGTVSQQDESSSASAPITSQTANPAIELQRTTTSPPVTGELDPVTTCVNCFNALTDAQRAEFEAQLPMVIDPATTTIEELCEFIDQHPQDASGIVENVQIILEDSIGVEPGIVNTIMTCLTDAFNIPALTFDPS